jgi:hypothetical protein
VTFAQTSGELSRERQTLLLTVERITGERDALAGAVKALKPQVDSHLATRADLEESRAAAIYGKLCSVE